MDELRFEDLDFILDGVSQEKKDAVEKKIAECMRIFMDRFNRVFEAPEVLYDLRGTTAGYALRRDGKPYIRLNVDLINSDHWDEMLNRTVPHEVAHVVQRQIAPDSKPHGREWKAMMFVLGLPPDRTHSYTATKVRNRQKMDRPHQYLCDCPDRIHHLTDIRERRIRAGTVYHCTYCNGNLRKLED